MRSETHALVVDAVELDVHPDVVDPLQDGCQTGRERAVGLEVDRVAPFGQQGEKRDEPPGLEQWLATGHAHGMVRDGAPQPVDGACHLGEAEWTLAPAPIAAAGGLLETARSGALLESLRLVAVGAPDVAAGEAEEDLTLADERALTLDRREDLGHQHRRVARHGVVRAGSETPASAKPRARSWHASQAWQGTGPGR